MVVWSRSSSIEEEPAKGLLEAFGVEVGAMYPGFSMDVGPSASVDDFIEPKGVYLVGEEEGTPLVGGGLKRLGEGLFEFKRMFVVEAGRGKGLGRALLRRLEEEARRLAGPGRFIIRMDTGAKQLAATKLYLSEGYIEIEDYNGNPFASVWFEKLVGPKPIGRVIMAGVKQLTDAEIKALSDADTEGRPPTALWPRKEP